MTTTTTTTTTTSNSNDDDTPYLYIPVEYNPIDYICEPPPPPPVDMTKSIDLLSSYIDTDLLSSYVDKNMWSSYADTNMLSSYVDNNMWSSYIENNDENNENTLSSQFELLTDEELVQHLRQVERQIKTRCDYYWKETYQTCVPLVVELHRLSQLKLKSYHIQRSVMNNQKKRISKLHHELFAKCKPLCNNSQTHSFEHLPAWIILEELQGTIQCCKYCGKTAKDAQMDAMFYEK